jgi:hypothetical protein
MVLVPVISVQADPFEVVLAPCKGYRSVERQWRPEPALPFAKGAVVDGKPIAGRGDQVIVMAEKTYFSVPLRCLKPVTLVGGVPAAQVRSRAKRRTSFRIESGILAWQETAVLASPAGDAYPLRAGSFGGMVGVAYQRGLSARWDLQGLVAFVYGNSELGESTDDPISEIDYLASGSTSLGGLLEVSLLWTPSNPDVALGLGVPLLVRSAGWPVPTGGYALDSSLAVEPGLFLEGRITRGSWVIVPRFGILSGLGNVAWGLNAGLRW